MVKNMLKSRAEKVAALIQEYRALKFETLDSVETVEDLVFYLYDKGAFQQNLTAYPLALSSLHKLLHQPEVISVIKSVVGKDERDVLIKMLHHLYEFMDTLREEQYATILEEKYVRIHLAGDSTQRLLEIEADYRSRIQALLSQQGTSA